MYLVRAKFIAFTVFEALDIKFNRGINIFIGENGTGKTHIMKILYSACCASDPRVSFTNKIVATMLPDDFKISRLITRTQGNHSAEIKITAIDDVKKEEKYIQTKFNNKTRKWNADVVGETTWEKTFTDTSCIFIPAKEILSNSYNLSAAVERNNVKFDDTYIDIIHSAKIDISMGRNSDTKKAMLSKIEKITNGKVVYDPDRDEFYLKKGQSKQEFNLVAEGIRKIALLWQLVKNGTLEKGAVLFWDEPEANINPSYISIIVDLLLELQSKGVQIFISTHDYMLAKYFEINRKSESDVIFHSFNKTGDISRYMCCEKFGELKNNSIIKAFDILLDKIYGMED